MNKLRIYCQLFLLCVVSTCSSCYSKRATLETKHINQLKDLYILIYKYGENNGQKSPKSLTELRELVDEGTLDRLTHCLDERNSRMEWVYFGAMPLNELKKEILIEGPFKYNSGKRVYLDSDGHVFLK